MPLSYSELKTIDEFEKEFATPQRRLLLTLRRWRDLIICLATMVIAVAGLIVLAWVN